MCPGLDAILEKLLTDAGNTRCLSTLQSCHSLTYLVKRGWDFVSG